MYGVSTFVSAVLNRVVSDSASCRAYLMLQALLLSLVR